MSDHNFGEFLLLQIQHFLQFVKTIYKDLPTNVVWNVQCYIKLVILFSIIYQKIIFHSSYL